MNPVSAQFAKCQTYAALPLTRYRPTGAQEHHQTLLGCQGNDEITSPPSAIGTTAATTTTILPDIKCISVLTVLCVLDLYLLSITSVL